MAKDAKPPDLLERDGRELTADRAAALPKTYGRKEEVFALARALGGKKSVVLLGPPGVGKTAIVKKLLFYLHDDRLPELAGAKVFEISTVGLCADTRYTGMQEDKIKLLLASARPDRLHARRTFPRLPRTAAPASLPRVHSMRRASIIWLRHPTAVRRDDQKEIKRKDAKARSSIKKPKSSFRS